MSRLERLHERFAPGKVTEKDAYSSPDGTEVVYAKTPRRRDILDIMLSRYQTQVRIYERVFTHDSDMALFTLGEGGRPGASPELATAEVERLRAITVVYDVGSQTKLDSPVPR